MSASKVHHCRDCSVSKNVTQTHAIQHIILYILGAEFIACNVKYKVALRPNAPSTQHTNYGHWKQEYTLDGTPVHHKAAGLEHITKNTLTHIGLVCWYHFCLVTTAKYLCPRFPQKNTYYCNLFTINLMIL